MKTKLYHEPAELDSMPFLIDFTLHQTLKYSVQICQAGRIANAAIIKAMQESKEP